MHRSSEVFGICVEVRLQSFLSFGTEMQLVANATSV
jgi:hypothetical protein